jgi:hypothetical protein
LVGLALLGRGEAEVPTVSGTPSKPTQFASVFLFFASRFFATPAAWADSTAESGAEDRRVAVIVRF